MLIKITEWRDSSMPTLIIGGILLILALLAIRNIIKTRKSGGCSGCSGGCSGCSGSCHSTNQPKK